ncbi:hypothetical protein L596_002006 [Steinernema carpocapsae]|uniref:Uncharacterized protein n=1 Tax=Steinernema carpocapsae TaxID=34508 RepID=A0A4V6I7K2_STECR|nr:hypothetical protein L596_002006 [Steinernema carpocapsae]
MKLGMRLPFLPSKATLLTKQAQQEEKVLALTAYELDMIPKLWWNIRNHYPYFCETVCHSWMMKCPTMVVQLNKHGFGFGRFERINRLCHPH